VTALLAHYRTVLFGSIAYPDRALDDLALDGTTPGGRPEGTDR
jgi:hypothetical protein